MARPRHPTNDISTDDFTITNMTGTEYQVSMQLTALNGDETVERSEVVS